MTVQGELGDQLVGLELGLSERRASLPGNHGQWVLNEPLPWDRPEPCGVLTSIPGLSAHEMPGHAPSSGDNQKCPQALLPVLWGGWGTRSLLVESPAVGRQGWNVASPYRAAGCRGSHGYWEHDGVLCSQSVSRYLCGAVGCPWQACGPR